MRLGLLFILGGSLYLLRNMGMIDSFQWPIIWPIIVILIGISMITRRNGCKMCNWGKSTKEGCDCSCGACKACETK